MDLYLYEFEANAAPDLSSKSEKDVGTGNRLARPMLEVKTCQRSFFLGWSPLPLFTSSEGSVLPRRFYEGVDAYEFLLRFATGLESEIKGETDVFGQLKTAIRHFQETYPEADDQGLFAKLFEDTKEIRTQYLHGIGGNTYGALSRRLLNPSPASKVLILGAGQISKAVAPYFADSQLRIFNRSQERLAELRSDLEKKGHSGIVYSSSDSEIDTWIGAQDLILIATPVNSPIDEKVIAHLSSRTQRPTLLHLGGQAKELAHFTDAGIRVLSLSDLFEMEREQSLLREKQISRALEACRKRALLRSLARSISIPHGWEDLALFY